jgi:hypothetical protein
LVRARVQGDRPGQILLSPADHLFRYNSKGELKRVRNIPTIEPKRVARLEIQPGSVQQVHTVLPEQLGAKPGRSGYFVVFADRHVQIDALALVPLQDEFPPPAPKPWMKGASETTPELVRNDRPF